MTFQLFQVYLFGFSCFIFFSKTKKMFCFFDPTTFITWHYSSSLESLDTKLNWKLSPHMPVWPYQVCVAELRRVALSYCGMWWFFFKSQRRLASRNAVQKSVRVRPNVRSKHRSVRSQLKLYRQSQAEPGAGPGRTQLSCLSLSWRHVSCWWAGGFSSAS